MYVHLWLLLVAACHRPAAVEPADTPPISDPTPAEDSAAEPAPPDDVVVGDTAAPPFPGVRLRVEDPSARRLGGISVSLCARSCYVGRTLGNGEAKFEALPAGRYVLHNLSYPGINPAEDAQAWSSFFDFVDVPEGGAVDLRSAPYVVPQVTERHPLGAGLARFADGALEITWDADRVVLPAAVGEPGSATVGAVDVPPSRWPRLGLEGVTITRAFALSPFEATTHDGSGFTVSVRADGDAAWGMWVAVYEEAALTGRFTRVEVTHEAGVIRGTVPQLSWVIVGTPDP